MRRRDLPPHGVLGFAVMRLLRLLPLVLLAALLAPSVAQAADVPSNKTLYADGPSGRFLMDGGWLFRLDAADQGVRRRFYRQSSSAGWSLRRTLRKLRWGTCRPTTPGAACG